MGQDRKKFNTGEIPLQIQNILLKYGEKQKIGHCRIPKDV